MMMKLIISSLLSLSSLRASSALYSFRAASERIRSSARENYINYWHSQSCLPSQPSGPAENNNVDPGLVRSTSPSPLSINPADWVSLVPSKLTSVPRQAASIRWPGFSPGPGDTMITGQMKDRPHISWSAQTTDLFTIMIIDEGIAFLNGRQYVHWLVTNVPGDGNILEGTEMMRYVEPFSASPDDPPHPMLVLVFKQQSGRLELEEYQRGCNPSIVTDRSISQKYIYYYEVKLTLQDCGQDRSGLQVQPGAGGRDLLPGRVQR